MNDLQLGKPVQRRKARGSTRHACPLCQETIRRGSVTVRLLEHVDVDGKQKLAPRWAHDECVQRESPTLF